MKPTLRPFDAGRIKVNGRYCVTTLRHFQRLTTTSTAKFKHRCYRVRTELQGDCFQKIGFRNRFIAECQIPVTRGIIAIADGDCHGLLVVVFDVKSTFQLIEVFVHRVFVEESFAFICSFIIFVG